MNSLHKNIDNLLIKLSYPDLQAAFLITYLVQNTDLFSYLPPCQVITPKIYETALYTHVLEKKVSARDALDSLTCWSDHESYVSYNEFSSGYFWSKVALVLDGRSEYNLKRLNLDHKPTYLPGRESGILLHIQHLLFKISLKDLHKP